MKQKRFWTRAEKWLLASPLLILAVAGAVWFWRERAPKIIEVAHSSSIKSLSFSPDSRRLIVDFESDKTFAGAPVSPGNYGVTRAAIFDVKTGSKICDLSLPSPNVYAAEYDWSPDGARIVAGYNDGTTGAISIKSGKSSRFNEIGKIGMWDATSGMLLKQWLYAPVTKDSTARVYFSRDGRKLVGYGYPVTLFDATSGSRSQIFKIGNHHLVTGRFNRSLDKIAIGPYSGNRVEVRETKNNRVVWQTQTNHSSDLQWNQRDVLGISDSRGGKLILWDGKTRRVLPSPPFAGVSRFALSNSAPVVALAQVQFLNSNTLEVANSNVIVWNYATQKELWHYKTKRRFFDFDWSPNEKYLKAQEVNRIGRGGKVWVFDAMGKVRHEKESDVLGEARWSPDSKQLAIAGDGQIEIVRLD